MGDMGDDFRALRDESKERRAHNRESSAQMLHASEIKFETRNLGAHLIVTGPKDELFDFWPGTGRWIGRISKRKGYGVRNLIASIKRTT